MPLSWTEIKSRELAFSKTWEDAGNEDSQAKPYLIDFFEVFGITDKRVASFKHALEKHDGGRDYKGEKSDAARVYFLFERYQQLTSLLPAAEHPKRKRKPA